MKQGSSAFCPAPDVMNLWILITNIRYHPKLKGDVLGVLTIIGRGYYSKHTQMSRYGLLR